MRSQLDHARHTGVDVREQHTVSGAIDDEGRAWSVTCTDAAGNAGIIRAKSASDAASWHAPAQNSYFRSAKKVNRQHQFRSGVVPRPGRRSALGRGGTRDGLSWSLPR